MDKLSVVEQLLVAAGDLAAAGKPEFTAEDLVVRAHERFPEAFSLRGYPQFPDSNRVLTKIMGKENPLFTRGWLEKTGSKMYRLTAKGLHDLQELDPSAHAASIRIDKPLEEQLGRLLASTAFEMFAEDREQDVTFHHFTRFVGLAVSDKLQVLRGKLRSTSHAVEQAVKLGESNQTLSLTFRAGTRDVTPRELLMLGAAWTFLQKKFKVEMEEWEAKIKSG
ncbi:MAG TPA: hypothetical protein VG963_23805 [Polyangiaceae bacterium]|nr:hypothetical protein [Polyangiaceae bacterium]